jgi:hypothetical protein
VPVHEAILNVTLPQDQMLFHFLTQRLHLLLLEPDNTPAGLDPQNILPARIEELELAALLLDILLATLRDSNCISDKIQACAGFCGYSGFHNWEYVNYWHKGIVNLYHSYSKGITKATVVSKVTVVV